jgi:hypothetical protein
VNDTKFYLVRMNSTERPDVGRDLPLATRPAIVGKLFQVCVQIALKRGYCASDIAATQKI